MTMFFQVRDRSSKRQESRSFFRRSNLRASQKKTSRGGLFSRSLRLEPLEDRRLLAMALHVDADAPDGGDGLAWETAYNDLQPALSDAAARNGDADGANDVDAIWIVEGTYTPSALRESGDVRSASYSLLDGVTLYGGFAGIETTLNGRDWSIHVTSLSGDLGTPDDNSDNAYTVVYCGVNTKAAVDGISISGGNADGSNNSFGGGICGYGALTLTNCTVSDNSAGEYGGAIFTSGTLTVTNSTLSRNNSAGYEGGGGAVFNSGTLTITNSTISENNWTGEYGSGGGIDSVNGIVTIINSTLSGNSAGYMGYGGGIEFWVNEDGTHTLTLTNCTLSDNSADIGGAISFYNSYGVDYPDLGTLTLTNCALSGNSAGYLGGGIYFVGTLRLTNCTLSSNSAAESGGGIFNDYSVCELNNTIVAENTSPDGPDLGQFDGTFFGFNNLIGVDPLLSEWTQFENGLWGQYPLIGSPAIDAGNNDLLSPDTLDLDRDGNSSEPLPTDLAGKPRVLGGAVDIGACESLPEQFAVISHVPRGQLLPGQTELMLSFDRETTTLSPDDLALLGPDGAVPITSVSRMREGNGWSEYAVRFDPIGRPGEYQLIVMPTVRDAEGDFLDQDLDDTPGESDDDRYVASWLLSGPMVTSHEPIGISTPDDQLTDLSIVFSRAMAQDSFSLADIEMLAGPDGAVSVTGYEWCNEQTLQVMFEPVTGLGTVSIALGTGIYDQWGNALDQNQNGLTGEADDAWTGSVLRSSSNAIDQDMVISSTAGELLFDETLRIDAGATLTIEAGVTLKFAAGAGLTVNGELVALGTVDIPVVFTSSAGSSAWPGIRVMSTGTIKLDHTEVRHAQRAVDSDSEGARAVLNNTTLRDGGFGIYVYSPYAEVIAENCLIANNAKTGVFVRADSRHTFKNCTIVGNGFGDSGWYGAGVHLGGSILTLENCIVAFNKTGMCHQGDPPTVVVCNTLFHNPAGQEIVWNGDPGMPDLSAEGNTTANPLFMDRENGNYELAAGSPAIDSGTGIRAPAADLLGRSRYDDLGMPNLGTGYPAFVDMGAYERQGGTPAGDLGVTYVSNPDPEVVASGDTFDLQWTVSNTGVVEVTGPWQDLVYLSDDAYLGGGDELLATVDHNTPLAAGADYTENLTLTVPTTSGPKYVLVHTQLVGSNQKEAVKTNNLGISARVLAVDVPALSVGTPIMSTAAQGQWDYYRFDAEPGRTVLFTLDGDAGRAALYLRRGLPPTLSSYDATGNIPNQADQELRLLEPVADTYYLGVEGGSGSYTLSADLTTLNIRQVTPDEVGNGGTVTIRILGDGFHPDAQVQLIAPDQTVIEGDEYYDDSTRLFATFDLAGASASHGVYDVVVTNPAPASATLSDAVRIVNRSNLLFTARLSMPAIARPGRVIECRIEYTNTGKLDIAAPILTLDSGLDDTAWKLPSGNDWIEGPDFHFMGLSSEGMPTILRPGQTESIVVQLRLPLAGDQVKVTLSSVGAVPNDGSNILIDWQEFEDDVRPPDMSPEDWAVLLAQLQAEIGDTWGDYATMLRERVEYWHEQGQTIYSVRELFGMPDPDPKSHPQDVAHTKIRTSYTPEDKFGPAGYDVPGTPEGSEVRYIPADETLGYRVEFWNKPDAKVPTQDAIIIDRLDPAVFDINSLEITRAGFLNWDFEVASGQVVNTRIDCMPEMNIAVEVRAGLGMEVSGFANNGDIDENTLVFWFHCIDPETGEWPEDPMAGFLPPYNPETGFEIGWIEYAVDPVGGLASGTQLTNLAYVEFDFAGDIYDHPAPKVDPTVEPAEPAPWINTIDAAGPESRVEKLPSTTTDEVLTIRWNGLDDAGGSGIAGYDVYVSVDNGPFQIWLDDTADTEAIYVGVPGRQYRFYSIATDNVGHSELPPDTPDAVVTVEGGTNSPPLADANGPYTVPEGGAVQLDASGSSDNEQPDNTTLTYAWDFDGDGQYDDATGIAPAFSAAGVDAPQTITVGLLVTDDDGASDTATALITVTQPEPIDLGTVDFTQLSPLVLQDGNIWYRLTAARSGQLTAIASAAAGSAAVSLYDSGKALPALAVSSATEGVERLDHAVEAGATYFLRIAGSSTDAALTIANLVTTTGTEIQVFGTDGADAFEFAATGSYTVAIKGVEYHFDDTVYETIVFNGGLGDDSAMLTGGAGPEVARLYPDHGTFGENGFLVTVNDTTAITAHSGGEGDMAFMYDSPGDDEFVARKGYGKLAGDAFSLEAFDFMVTYGYATTRNGGSDVAYMEDSPGADKFKFDWPKADQFFGKMYGGGDYFNRAKNFERIVAAMTDGKDTVRLFDSTGNDTFFGQKAESRLTGPGYDVTVSGYDSLIAYASKGTDIAYLEDSEDDDTTRARPNKIILWGGDDARPTYEITARKFDEYHFEAKNGGFDRAKFHDTIFNDYVHASGNSASMYGNNGELDLLYEAVAFEWVRLYATDNGSQDTLEKDDPLEFELVYDEGLWDNVD